MPLYLTISIAFVFIIAGVAFAFIVVKERRKKLRESLEQRLFLVRFPRGRKEGTNVLEEIAKSEKLFNSITSLKKPIIFEIAVSHIGEEINFYASVPESFVNTFTKQIHSIWSDAHIEEAGDYNPFSPQGVFMGAYIKQEERFALPIKTYREDESDTFQSILGGLAKIEEIGEGGAIQVIIKPALTKQKKEIKSILERLKSGGSLNKGAGEGFGEIITKAISSSPTKDESEKNKPEKRIDEALIEVVGTKLNKPIFRVNIRVVASASNKDIAKSTFDSLTAGFSRFTSPKRNELKIVPAQKANKFAHEFSFREFSSENEMILNSEELASIFHFPTPFTEVPKLKVLRARQLPPPANMPKEGVVLGESVYRGEKKRIFIEDGDRRQHLYMIGQTGTGKSNLIVNLAHQDIMRGKGVGVIDPHGDLIEHILGIVPPGRADDVIVFDPSELHHPIGLNMLEYNFDRPEEKTFVTNEMIGIFDKLYDLKATGGPMFEYYLRNALQLLLEDMQNEPATLMEVSRVFSDAEFRNKKLSRINNPSVINFWKKEAEKAGGDASLANITPYIASKFASFTANDYMRVIVGQEKSSFNFRKIMDERKILLVNLSKGRIGEMNANLLGMIILGKLLMASLGRVDIKEDERKDFYLYIDEFQNFTTDSIATILSEARKYKLNLIVANQFIAQLKETIRDAVFGNVGSLVSFRIGAPDAEMMTKQFEPHLAADDFINIDNFYAYTKLLIRKESSSPFQIKTLKSRLPEPENAEEIKTLSRNKYGRPKEEVEKEIYRRLRD